MGFTRSEVMPSKWLSAEEFSEGEIRWLTIKDVSQEEFKNQTRSENKFVLHFREDKPLVLNKTNAKQLFDTLGEDTDEWFGKVIGLYATEVESFGEMVKALRIKRSTGTPSVQTQAVQTQVMAANPNPINPTTRSQIINQAKLTWGDAAPERLKAFMKDTFGRGIDALTEFQGQQALEKLQSLPVVPTEPEDEADPFADE